jgi:preprotein translocase subunit YajC
MFLSDLSSAFGGSLRPVLAQAQPAGPLGAAQPFLMMGVIFVIFYFLLWRPQQKERKQQEELLASLQKGDRVYTAAGMLGTIVEVRDQELLIEIAERVNITIERSSVRRKAGAPAEGTSR